MNLIRIFENDDIIIDYDQDKSMYRVSVFRNNHFADEYWIDTYSSKEIESSDELYIKGATDFMSYMRKHHRNVSLKWKGSNNQRVINVQELLNIKRIVLYE